MLDKFLAMKALNNARGGGSGGGVSITDDGKGNVTISSGGSSVSIPSDWNANEGEPGHILNRPFYSEMGMGELVPETTLTVSEDDGFAVLPTCFDPVNGAEYVVKYNGTEYTCTATEMEQDGMPFLYLGNGSMAGLEDSGEPFAMMAFSSEVAEQAGTGGIVYALDGSTEFTLSISGQVEIPHTIPAKYNTAPVILYCSGNYAYKTEDTTDTSNLLIKSELEEFVRTGRTIYISEVNNIGTTIYSPPLTVCLAADGGLIEYRNPSANGVTVRTLLVPNTRTIE